MWGREEIAPAALMGFLERPDVISEQTGMKLKRIHTVLQVSGRWEMGGGGGGGRRSARNAYGVSRLLRCHRCTDVNGTKVDTQLYRCQDAGGVGVGGGWREVGGALSTHMGFPERSDATSEENGTKADTQLYRCQGAGHRPGRTCSPRRTSAERLWTVSTPAPATGLGSSA